MQYGLFWLFSCHINEKIEEIYVATPMGMIFENVKNVYVFANVVWWLTCQHILKRIAQPYF